MGKHGPPSSHPSGEGYTTSSGYHRLTIWDPKTKTSRLVFAHTLIWEQAHGPIAPGWHVHHRNGDKQDNRLANLQLVDATTHKRLHSGCEMRDGVWWKQCSICEEFEPITEEHWYISPRGYPLYGRCRPCHIHRVVGDKRKRKARRRAALQISE